MVLFINILNIKILPGPDIAVTTSRDLNRDFIAPIYFGFDTL